MMQILYLRLILSVYLMIYLSFFSIIFWSIFYSIEVVIQYHNQSIVSLDVVTLSVVTRHDRRYTMCHVVSCRDRVVSLCVVTRHDTDRSCRRSTLCRFTTRHRSTSFHDRRGTTISPWNGTLSGTMSSHSPSCTTRSKSICVVTLSVVTRHDNWHVDRRRSILN